MQQDSTTIGPTYFTLWRGEWATPITSDQNGSAARRAGKWGAPITVKTNWQSLVFIRHFPSLVGLYFSRFCFASLGSLMKSSKENSFSLVRGLVLLLGKSKSITGNRFGQSGNVSQWICGCGPLDFWPNQTASSCLLSRGLTLTWMGEFLYLVRHLIL